MKNVRSCGYGQSRKAGDASRTIFAGQAFRPEICSIRPYPIALKSGCDNMPHSNFRDLANNRKIAVESQQLWSIFNRKLKKGMQS